MSVSETAPPPSLGSETYHKKPCPIGYYCPPLASAPLPCPPGTRGSNSLAKNLEDCQACPAGTFNHLPAQAACFPCGSSSSSQPGELLFLCEALPAVKREPNKKITYECDFSHMLPQLTTSCGIFLMLCVLTTPHLLFFCPAWRMEGSIFEVIFCSPVLCQPRGFDLNSFKGRKR